MGSRNGPGPGGAALGGCRRAEIEALQVVVGPGEACAGMVKTPMPFTGCGSARSAISL
jgi:hypothetical protein